MQQSSAWGHLPWLCLSLLSPCLPGCCSVLTPVCCYPPQPYLILVAVLIHIPGYGTTRTHLYTWGSLTSGTARHRAATITLVKPGIELTASCLGRGSTALSKHSGRTSFLPFFCFLLLLLFWATPCSVHVLLLESQNHSWQYLVDHMWCQRWKLDLVCASQAPYVLHYLSGPSLLVFGFFGLHLVVLMAYSWLCA